MIHKAGMPVYIVIQIFLADGCKIQPEVVQEVLADLKITCIGPFRLGLKH